MVLTIGSVVSHTIMDGVNEVTIIDGQIHPIMDGINNCKSAFFYVLLTTVTFIQLWMVKVVQLSFMEVNDCHPKMDGQFLDVY